MGVDIAGKRYGILFHQEEKKESVTLVETVLSFQLLEMTLGELSKRFARLSNLASNGIIV